MLYHIYTYSWFSLWKERHQIHFKFGEWSALGHTLLPAPDENKRGSTISDSGTFPGPQLSTTTSIVNSITNGANEKSISSKCGNGSGEGSSASSSVRWRKPILTIPAPYSHRFQIITDDSNSENNTTPTTTANSESNSSSNNSNNNKLYGTRYYFPPPLISSSGSEKEGEKEVDEGEGNKEWLCIYAYK